MLVLARGRGESITIGDDIEIKIIEIRWDKVRLGVTAPKEIPVHRKEVYAALKSGGSKPPIPNTEGTLGDTTDYDEGFEGGRR